MSATTNELQRRELLGTMLLIRRFEETGERLSLRGQIPAGIHPASGHEAVAVGTMSALQASDVVCGTHRSHHLALARGLDPSRTMAELYGKAPGLLGGRGGSMHLADFGHGFYGSNGIVGAGIGIAMGVALGMHMRQDASVAVGFVGDGGMNIGRVWEAINLAVIWGLPLIVLVENNLYAVETTSAEVTGGGSIVDRAKGFGIHAEPVDGQQVDAVHAAVAAARERAVAGGGPSLIEAETYRFSGHGSGEKASYRTREEIDHQRAHRDPIALLREQLIDDGELSPETFDELDTAAQARVAEAVAFARDAPWPDTATAVGGVGWDE
ncbi:thiamine pyrophosphate-dependent dehydrogenase E1 component subunit alpha [Conexibacter sp. CPCC 206217]|uniref:thiamine pyrophosphate-dependent dehydrogenase E1 component subunit alpha n=1 Tax=Conexibacter sp. CPCC 206217 TaxID=3064574 RepID=UPI002728434A|nr:thiamine pyrophosphate-dependent dehydrogenase E1 component subunit alpha [Conexibacter sp. CPCC 206217]MDO8210326.1 thiamine pyrophosphate-dependent dehydrogenase E1 component subunit alpha [Conexibacter sp. CPCC 206217]